ncbi:MAG: hypothetical protein HKO65_03635, partial [Gemmatimonadetes bacterium]|nr:hypothetical protein [Gemmatimonadota bacterium]
MDRPSRPIALLCLGISLLAGCDLEYPTTEWGEGGTPHSEVFNGFVLDNLHRKLPCTSCHDSGSLVPLFDPADANDCVACHQTDYDGKHAGSGYPTDCTSCHTPTVWSDGQF